MGCRGAKDPDVPDVSGVICVHFGQPYFRIFTSHLFHAQQPACYKNRLKNFEQGKKKCFENDQNDKCLSLRCNLRTDTEKGGARLLVMTPDSALNKSSCWIAG